MGSDRRQCPAKTKTIWQEDIRALHSELFPVILLSEQNVADKRLGRRHQHIRCIPATAGDMPAAVPDILFHFFILRRIIFLHPGIFHTTFEVEHIVGIAFQQKQILTERIPNILFDRCLDIPVPLGIQMSVGYHIGLRLFVLFVGLGKRGIPAR